MKIRLLLTGGLVTLFFAMTIAPALAEDGFSDVPSSHPNYTAITTLQDQGIIGGYPDGTFKPDQNVNRVEALKIILLAAKIEIDETATESRFTDTEVGQWYSPILNKAVELNIVSGYPDGTFKPTQNVNLVEALKIGQLSFGFDIGNIEVTDDPYADTPADSWYAPYIQFAKDNQLIDSDSDNKVYPDQPMTRANICELIYRIMNIQPETEETTTPEEETTTTPNVKTEYNVSIEKYIFSPKDMDVAVGSTVTWANNADTTHSVTSDGGIFDSGTLQPGETFSYTFNDEGTFVYHSESYSTMEGTITVKPANQIPTI